MSVHVWGGSGLVSIPISGLLVSVSVFTIGRINLMVSRVFFFKDNVSKDIELLFV